MQSASGVICAELVRDFLEFYKLDYTLAIFMPEVNMSHQNALSKEELSKKIGLNEASNQKPLMAQLIESFIANEKPASSVGLKDNYKKEEEKSNNSMIAANKKDKVEPII